MYGWYVIAHKYADSSCLWLKYIFGINCIVVLSYCRKWALSFSHLLSLSLRGSRMVSLYLILIGTHIKKTKYWKSKVYVHVYERVGTTTQHNKYFFLSATDSCKLSVTVTLAKPFYFQHWCSPALIYTHKLYGRTILHSIWSISRFLFHYKLQQYTHVSIRINTLYWHIDVHKFTRWARLVWLSAIRSITLLKNVFAYHLSVTDNIETLNFNLADNSADFFFCHANSELLLCTHAE